MRVTQRQYLLQRYSFCLGKITHKHLFIIHMQEKKDLIIHDNFKNHIETLFFHSQIYLVSTSSFFAFRFIFLPGGSLILSFGTTNFPLSLSSEKLTLLNKRFPFPLAFGPIYSGLSHPRVTFTLCTCCLPIMSRHAANLNLTLRLRASGDQTFP